MKFSDVFPEFVLVDDCLIIRMDWDSAKSLTMKDAVKYSRMKFERSLKALKNLHLNKKIYALYGTSTCPLCAKYIKQTNMGVTCYDCPIYKKTGRHGCQGTPYDDIVDAIFVEQFIPALRREIAFLKEIEKELPDGE